MNPALIRLELRRALRNRRSIFFATVLPVAFFLIFSTENSKAVHGIDVAPWEMMSMATYGAMNALFTGGGIIAGERSIGWPRQLRIAGLTNRDYVSAKIMVAYLTALPGLILVFILGATTKHVHLSAGQWLGSGISVLLCLLPVAALGVAIGYTARPQALQAIFGIGSAILALLGGLWFPPSSFTSQGLVDVMKCLPTYWAAQAGRAVLEGSWLGMEGTVILAAWFAGLALLAGTLYRRDSLRPSIAGAT